jgi:transcriptional regulator with XRE-family HTH domain
MRNRVREFREMRGWTLEQLAEKSGLSVSQISKLERNKRGWSVTSLDKIATALGVQVGELLDAPAGQHTLQIYPGMITAAGTNEGQRLTVSERVKSRMEALGITTAQLAKRMGVSRQTVENWINDVYLPKHPKVPRLAQILGVDARLLTPYGMAPVPIDENGNADGLAYLRRIDNTVSRMAEDIDQVKTRLTYLEGRVTSLESAVHKRLDGMQKHLDNICARLDRSDRSDKQ